MKDKKFNIEDASSTQTADVLGITRRRVSQLCSQGIIKNNGKRGRYDVAQAIKDYAAYITDNGGGDIHTKLILARTKKIELQNDAMERKLICREDAVSVLAAAVDAFQTSSTGLPRKLAPKLARVNNSGQIRRIIEKEFDTARDTITSKLKAICGLPSNADINEVRAKLG